MTYNGDYDMLELAGVVKQANCHLHFMMNLDTAQFIEVVNSRFHGRRLADMLYTPELGTLLIGGLDEDFVHGVTRWNGQKMYGRHTLYHKMAMGIEQMDPVLLVMQE